MDRPHSHVKLHSPHFYLENNGNNQFAMLQGFSLKISRLTLSLEKLLHPSPLIGKTKLKGIYRAGVYERVLCPDESSAKEAIERVIKI